VKRFIAAIDQGTTSSRAILFSLSGKNIYSSQKEFNNISLKMDGLSTIQIKFGIQQKKF